MIKNNDGIVEGLNRAIINLFKMRPALANERRVDVEGDSIFGEAERVEASVGFVHLLLNVQASGRHVPQFRNAAAIDFLEASHRSAGRNLQIGLDEIRVVEVEQRRAQEVRTNEGRFQ